MSSQYYTIITNRGKELETGSTANGTTIKLKDFVVGDGSGSAVTPDPARTTLVNKVYQGAISKMEVSPDQSNQFIAYLVLPADIGGFVVREVGLLTDAGELYAVGNCAAIEKPASGVNVTLQFRLAVSETADITLIVSTGDGLFLRQDANLSDVKDAAKSRVNLGLKGAAVLDVGKAQGTVASGDDDRIVNALQSGKNLSDVKDKEAARSNLGLGNMSTEDKSNYVPKAGGTVGYLEKAKYYKTDPAIWTGAGGFSTQYTSNAAPFLVPYGFVAPKGTSSYNPIVKGIIYTDEHGYATAVSLGALTTGDAKFAQAVIHVIGDNGKSGVWSFDPNNGNFSCPGQVIPGTWTNFDNRYPIQDCISYVGLVSNSPNDPYVRKKDTNDIILLATKNWVNGAFQSINTATKGWNGWYKDSNTGMIFQWGVNNSNVIGNTTVNFPIAFPNVCVNVQNTWIRNSGNPGTSPWGFVTGFNNTSANLSSDNLGSYWFAIGW